MQDKFLKAIHTGLSLNAKKHTEETLGDRSTYLGASDVGGCPRKTILSKITPSEHNLTTHIRFMRGHMAEDILAQAFTAVGYKFERQVEIEHDCFGAPLKVHIDFVFVSEGTKTVSVLEVKSPEQMPEVPYESWELQLFTQMGLVALKYPGYTVKGAILGFQFGNDGLKLWNGYTPSDTVFGSVENRVADVWNDYQLVQAGEQIDLKTEWSPLCAFCDHIASCPRFQAEEIPEYDALVLEWEQLKAEAKKIEKEIDAKKDLLLPVVRTRGNFKAGGRLLREAHRSRTSYDKDVLGAFLAEHERTVEEFQTLSGYSFLESVKAKAA